MSARGDAPEANGHIRFLCDAMLGGLARWLRAAGYDAEFEHGIEDAELVSRAGRRNAVALSSDGGIFERNVVKSGAIRALYVPRDLRPLEQLVFVLEHFALPTLEPRCMSCGGELHRVEKTSVASEAPPLAYERHDEFWRCARCRKLLWQGTHWSGISARLARVADARRSEP